MMEKRINITKIKTKFIFLKCLGINIIENVTAAERHGDIILLLLLQPAALLHAVALHVALLHAVAHIEIHIPCITTITATEVVVVQKTI